MRWRMSLAVIAMGVFAIALASRSLSAAGTWGDLAAAFFFIALWISASELDRMEKKR